MKAAIAILIFSILTGAVESYGQKKAESYKKFKSSAQRSINSLLQEASDLKEINPREALNKVEEALGMSIAREDVLNEGKCYVLLGEVNEHIEEWKLALENFNTAHQKLKGKYTATPEYNRAITGLGHSYLKLGNYESALVYFREALSLRTGVTERAERQLDISEVYFQMGRYDEALKALEGIPFSNAKGGDPATDAKIQNQKAKIFARMNELDKAKDNYQSSQNTLRDNKAAVPAVEKEGEQSLQSAKEEIAGVLREQKRYDEEIELRNQAIEYNLKSKNLKEVSKDKVEISKAFEAKGETSAAIRELEEAAHIADTIGNPREQAKAFLGLASLYEKNGSNTQALSAYKRYSDAVGKIEKQNENKLTEKSELIKKQRDIEELSKNVTIGQTIERGTVARQQLVIYGLLVIILIIAVTSYFIYRSALASKIANQLLALKSLRSQMNPHFIFNALNSVNHFVAQNDERTANKFLSEFSRLMRLVLENSQEDLIPLNKEQEIISLYLKLEHYRFRDKFDYIITMDDNIHPESIQLPPMLLQPYIENAVWHGLRYRETKGNLSLHFRQEPGRLIARITDDGIGRKRSAELKTENQRKHQSTGLRNIQERLAILNKVYKANYQVTIEDLDPGTGTGTCVQIYLPITNLTNGYESGDH